MSHDGDLLDCVKTIFRPGLVVRGGRNDNNNDNTFVKDSADGVVVFCDEQVSFCSVWFVVACVCTYLLCFPS